MAADAEHLRFSQSDKSKAQPLLDEDTALPDANIVAIERVDN